MKNIMRLIMPGKWNSRIIHLSHKWCMYSFL